MVWKPVFPRNSPLSHPLQLQRTNLTQFPDPQKKPTETLTEATIFLAPQLLTSLNKSVKTCDISPSLRLGPPALPQTDSFTFTWGIFVMQHAAFSDSAGCLCWVHARRSIYPSQGALACKNCCVMSSASSGGAFQSVKNRAIIMGWWCRFT